VAVIRRITSATSSVTVHVATLVLTMSLTRSHAPDHVALADDADQLIVGTDHDQRPDRPRRHPVHGDGDGRVGVDHLDGVALGRQDRCDVHRTSLPTSSVRRSPRHKCSARA
jgi:hypothetical protein